jgi:hypothetical protein
MFMLVSTGVYEVNQFFLRPQEFLSLMNVDSSSGMTRCFDASESVPVFVGFGVSYDRADTRWRHIRRS